MKIESRKEESKKQAPMSDLSEFEITAPEPVDAVEIKKKSGRGEL